MPKKRVKSKKKLTINYRILSHELYEAICSHVSMEELLEGHTMFDKDDPKVCQRLWKAHKERVMELWRMDHNNAGKRPYLFWKCEKLPAPVKEYKNQLEYLEKNKLIEAWEISGINDMKRLYGPKWPEAFKFDF